MVNMNSTHSKKNIHEHKPAKPLIIAHRGNSSEAPENTLTSVRQAIELAVDVVEIDVRLSIDSIPVVIHDPDLTRNAGMRHSPHIHELPFAKIQQIDVGAKFGKEFAGERIPRFSDLLHLKWRSTSLMVEIKECPQSSKEIVDAVFQDILAVHSPLPQLIFGSFSPAIYCEVQQRLVEMQTNLMSLIGIVEDKKHIDTFLSAGAKRLALWHKLITPGLAQSLQDQDVEIWTFTVDDLALANHLVSIGVHGVISNYPRRMLRELRGPQQK